MPDTLIPIFSDMQSYCEICRIWFDLSPRSTQDPKHTCQSCVDRMSSLLGSDSLKSIYSNCCNCGRWSNYTYTCQLCGEQKICDGCKTYEHECVYDYEE